MSAAGATIKVLLVPNAAMRFVPRVKKSGGASRGGGLVGTLLPRPPGMNDNKTEEPDTRKKEQQVWTVRAGQLVAVSFTKGLSDGQQTEMVIPSNCQAALWPGGRQRCRCR